jgi:curli biogenesis system outer membrane secretion channel CsgG
VRQAHSVQAREESGQTRPKRPGPVQWPFARLGRLALIGVLALPGTGAGAAPPPPKRIPIAVLDFDYGTIQDRWWGQADIGKGLATQVVDALVEDGTFRVIERTKLATILGEQDFAKTNRAEPEAAALAKVGKVLGIRYILAGSVTKFASSAKKFGGGVTGAVARSAIGPLGGFSLRKVKHEVELTARLIDTKTAEVVASFKGAGLSKKGGGIGLEGGAGGEGASLNMTSGDYKVSGLGEAQEQAALELVRNLLAQRSAIPE